MANRKSPKGSGPDLQELRHAALLEQLPTWFTAGERRELAKPLAKAVRDGWHTWIRTRSDAQAVLEGCTWSLSHARRVVDFCTLGIVQVNGRFRGKPLELLPYQWTEVVGPLFGWLKPDGFRRHRKGYVTVAKKNGKSGLCAGLQLYGLMADQEYGANNFCAAIDKLQAGLVFGEAVKYAKKSPKIASRCTISTAKNEIVYGPTLSKLSVISSDVANAEGIDAHFLIYDELHMAKTDKLWDVLEFAGAARPNSVVPLVITTAGSDLRSLCGQQYKYAKQILAGELVDTSFLACVYEAADIQCDPLDPAAWAAANPALGIIVNADDLKTEAKRAIAQGRLANFRRRRLNQWVADDDQWSAAKLWAGASEVDMFTQA